MNGGRIDYRARLYRDYLTIQAKSDIAMIRQDLTHRAPYLRRLIRRWIPEDRSIRVLDLGCGYGALLYFLKEAGYRNLRGIDRSPEQVAISRCLGLECVEDEDVLDILRKSEDSSYDVIIAFDVLEHFRKEEVLAVAEEVYRVLPNRGRLIVHVPNGEAIFSGGIYFGDFTHEIGFTRRSLHQLMNVVGFKNVHFAEDVPVVHGLKSGARYILWKVFRTMFRLIYMAETGDIGRELVLTQNLTAIVEK